MIRMTVQRPEFEKPQRDLVGMASKSEETETGSSAKRFGWAESNRFANTRSSHFAIRIKSSARKQNRAHPKKMSAIRHSGELVVY
jgi:hypothetical protein